MCQQEKHIRERDALPWLVGDACFVIETVVEILATFDRCPINAIEIRLKLSRVEHLVLGERRFSNESISHRSCHQLRDAVFRGVYANFKDARQFLLTAVGLAPVNMRKQAV